MTTPEATLLVLYLLRRNCTRNRFTTDTYIKDYTAEDTGRT